MKISFLCSQSASAILVVVALNVVQLLVSVTFARLGSVLSAQPSHTLE